MSLMPPEQQIRYILGATGEQESFLTEEEILNAIALYPETWRLAAAWIAESLAARAINDPQSFGLSGTMDITWGDQAAKWLKIAALLKEEAMRELEAAKAPIGIQAVELYRQGMNTVPEYTRKRGMRRSRRQ